MANAPEVTSERITVADSIEAVNELYYERGWTDGLPIIPPTEERVKRMMAVVKRDPQEVVAVLPPRSAAATVEKIALNAVMAGCLPEYLPVIIAVVAAMAEEEFNLLGVQATTHPCGPLIVVNGPIARELGINSRGNAFGPGVRANAAIGRAVRLIMLNVGGAIPVEADKSTHGQPAKYTYCVAENETESPWEPLHVERGFRAGESTVTVFGAEGPHNINDHESLTARGILTTAAGTMATAGNNNLISLKGEPILIMGPEHAATVAGDGYSKQQVKEFIFEHARLPLNMLSEENIKYRRKTRGVFGEYADSELVPLVGKSEDVVVMVLGGPGKHSCFVPTFGSTCSVTRRIKL
ncbi:hypothetical protein ACFLYF_05155 [Chloroflexota bacterium]